MESVETRLFVVPLAEVLNDAKHGDQFHFELITVTLADGTEGTGYTYADAKGGYAINAVKIKIGRENLDEDLERIRAVRELIGPDATFMVDANYSMSVDQAIAAAKAFQPYDIFWFEEPTIPDDYAGYGRITGWLKVARMARKHGF